MKANNVIPFKSKNHEKDILEAFVNEMNLSGLKWDKIAKMSLIGTIVANVIFYIIVFVSLSH